MEKPWSEIREGETLIFNSDRPVSYHGYDYVIIDKKYYRRKQGETDWVYIEDVKPIVYNPYQK